MSHRVSFVSVSILALVASLASVAGCSAESTDKIDGPHVGVTAEALKAAPFDVSFNGCSELASITTISVAEARTVVPSTFALAGDASGAPFVVRVASCSSVTVADAPAEAGIVAQLGIGVVSPDGTGDINNYTAWYYTTSRPLALRLKALGVPAEHVPGLVFDVVPNADHTGGALTIDAQHPAHPTFHVSAPVVEPGPFAIPFAANWWSESGPNRTKMSTPSPAIRFGGATATLHTARFGDLGRLLQSSTATFALLDSYNRFPTAPMSVTTSRARP